MDKIINKLIEYTVKYVSGIRDEYSIGIIIHPIWLIEENVIKILNEKLNTCNNVPKIIEVITEIKIKYANLFLIRIHRGMIFCHDKRIILFSILILFLTEIIHIKNGNVPILIIILKIIRFFSKLFSLTKKL